MKKLIKVTIFILIFFILLHLVIKMLWLEETPISKFYDEPQNSLDVIYIGSSNAYKHFNTVLAYDLYGFATGMLSTDNQMLVMAKYMIKEARKYQKPSVYVIDIAKIADDLSDFTEGDIRKTLDSMKFSKNRIEAINEALSYRKDVTERDYTNFYFSFLMYHNRMKNFPKLNITGVKKLYKGYLLEKLTTTIEKEDEYYWNNEISNLQEENKKVLENLIQYIKEEKLNVIFVVPKRYFDTDLNEKINDAIRIIEENKLKVFNFNKIDEIDNNTDFYDKWHVNVYGATKSTMILSKYLKENYDLPNHKGDIAYKSWEEEYTRFKEDYKEYTENDYEEKLNIYKKQIILP